MHPGGLILKDNIRRHRNSSTGDMIGARCKRKTTSNNDNARRLPQLSFTTTALLLVAVITCHHNVIHAASTTSNPSLSITPAKTTIRNNTTYTSFLDKFETHGPTLTVTLRDPSTTALIGSSGSDGRHSKPNLMSKLQQYREDQRRMPEVDDGTFGISSKLAALFHITPSTAVISSQNNMVSKQFADGYMMDDGEVLLSPPSETAKEGSFTTGNLFPLRGLIGGLTRWSRNWSECLSNVHPEMRYEIATRQSSSSSSSTANNAGVRVTKPFSSLPWLSSASCGIAWRPFPIQKAGGEERGINSPHYVRCCASLALPRLSNLWKSFTSDKQVRLRTRDLDVGLTYRDSSTGNQVPTVELLLGRTRPSLPPPIVHGSTARIKSILQSDKYRRNNHFIVRLATTGDEKGSKSGSAIEYARASLRLSTPSFLRRFRNKRGKGVTVTPSYDFIEGKARCVLSGDVGSTGRTRAVLRLDVDDSTLTLVRAIDGNKIVAPTISLQSGKIVYDYHLDLDGGKSSKVGSSLRAHVDPSKGVIIKWTDGVPGGAGESCWVTECRVPLGVSAPGPLAADVRVGRRWVM